MFSTAVALLMLLATPGSQATVYQSYGGYCDTTSNPGQSFVLYGLGQRAQATYGSGPYTACTYAPGNPSVLLGELVQGTGTLTNLVVKQQQLNGAAMGGTVTIWINPEIGGPALQTSISCTLAFVSTGLYQCISSGTYLARGGDRIIAIVMPPSGTSVSPVEATIDWSYTVPGFAFGGYCGSVSNPGQAFVLDGLGQGTNQNCVYGPGSPNVSAFLGTALSTSGPNVFLSNLYVKQEQLNSAAMGGTVTVWINPKSGGPPVQTNMGCTLTPSGTLYTCSDLSHPYTAHNGDKIIVIVTPPPGQSISPVIATLSIAG